MAAPDRRALDLIRERRKEMTRRHPEAVEVISPEMIKMLDISDPIPAQEIETLPEEPHSTLPASIDAVKFGAAIGTAIRESVAPLRKRIEALEAQVERQRSLTFKGAFQRAIHYPEGSVVTQNDRMYVAVKDIVAGESLRDGLPGWVLMFKGAPP